MKLGIHTTIAVAGLLLLGSCRGETAQKPPVHLNWNMDFQKRFDAQEANDFFRDGRAMRPQIEGTIAKGSLKDDSHRDFGRLESGDYAQSLPMALDRSVLERGKERYNIYCTPCHDRAGTGNGSVVQRGFMKPPNLADPRIQQMPVGQIYEAILKGSPSTIMPSYAEQIEVDDRWAIVAYVRALQEVAADSDPAGNQ